MDGSRSAGLLAATWASMVQLGREGYRGYAKAIFEASARMQDAVRSHPELRLLGSPTFLFSFTSDEFDIYHVNDFMRGRGWRFNGQQYPNALHMAVTRPQTQPGVAEAFATDLADAVAYAKEHAAGDAEVGRHLRRRGRRHDRRGRRVHQDGHGRHARHAAGRARRRDPVATARRAVRPRGRPRHRRPQGRPGVAHAARSPGTTTSPSPPATCPAAARCRTPTSGGTPSSTPPGRGPGVGGRRPRPASWR